MLCKSANRHPETITKLHLYFQFENKCTHFIRAYYKIFGRTLLVVMEDGGDATAIDHSNFRTSNIKVSAGPVKVRSFGGE